MYKNVYVLLSMSRNQSDWLAPSLVRNLFTGGSPSSRVLWSRPLLLLVRSEVVVVVVLVVDADLQQQR